MSRIAVAWIIAIIIAADLIALRVVLPGLINRHNDGLLVAAFLLVGGMLTANYVIIKHFGNPSRDNEE